MAGRTNRETGEITGHLNILFETTPMKSMNPAVLGTTYGELVIDLTKVLLRDPGSITSEPAEVAEYAISLADQLVDQLGAREVKAREYAESLRVIIPVDWAPSAEDGPSRSGEHWSQPEVDALVAQYKNGLTGAQIAVHHRRSWTAVSAQLAKYGLLRNAGGGTYERPDGSTWEL